MSKSERTELKLAHPRNISSQRFGKGSIKGQDVVFRIRSKQGLIICRVIDGECQT